MKKKIKKILAVALSITLILTIFSPVLTSAAEAKPSAKYSIMGPVGVFSSWGYYKPGNYKISTTVWPDAANNIMDAMSISCSVTNFLGIAGWFGGGCLYVQAGKWLMRYDPNCKVQVKLNDVESGKEVWRGFLNSGDTLYLGNDHKNYEVFLASTKSVSPMVAIVSYSNNSSVSILPPDSGVYYLPATKRYSSGAIVESKNYIPLAIPVPATPSSASISSANQCIGATANATWSSSSYASSYLVSLICTTNSAYSQPAKEMGGTGTYYVLNNPGTYKVSVRAKNSSGESGARESGTITIHPNLTVTFKDHDGKVLQTQSVPYGGVACPPVAPSREGYTFQGWNSGFDNVTADRTITANYKINRHTVRFVGHRGEVLKTQTVDWGTAATPPSVTPPEGYHFISWDSNKYFYVVCSITVTIRLYDLLVYIRGVVGRHDEPS